MYLANSLQWLCGSKRLGSAGGDVGLGFCDQMVQSACLEIGRNLPIPLVSLQLFEPGRAKALRWSPSSA
jgi:hypothetical protein